MHKHTIGRADKIDLPLLGLFNIPAKVDTGAYTSAIHYNSAEVKLIDGKKHLCFTLLDPEHPEFNDKIFTTPHFYTKKIKNSFGVAQKRYIIKTQVVLFDQTLKAEFSLSNRKNLKYPILLGRKLLQNHFIVDVDLLNLSFNLKNNN